MGFVSAKEQLQESFVVSGDGQRPPPADRRTG
jgi:hypothetical protein